MTTICTCPCGSERVEITGAPVMRFICHCRICQQVYGQPFADIVAVRSSQVVKRLSPNLRFGKHRPPPAVNRGVCAACNKPVVAFLPLAPMLGLAFVPAANFPGSAALPAPALHSFYDRRVGDVDDALPKVSGYWASQWAVSSRFMRSLVGRRRTAAT
ncbi:GFA family protein [Flagellatimonas centrodinii]|uniref:GFA family protein n=1 Tax=Flagellatimonas centrodinii TaxID=2806210 RepID=UPI001FEDB1C7|nr:GFA family protein [Flagellatimonas centrodinii]ULQ45575.1 GFA family protein [Flagellatimonas centrodinii]